MPTHRERILAVMRGEMVDVIPFVPRLDLWWLANVSRGTLPREFEGMTPDEIARSRGWAVYHMVPNFADVSGPEDALHRSIGLFNFKQSAYRFALGGGVEVEVRDADGQHVVEYHTPRGSARTIGGLTEEMKRAGASLGWVEEHLIKEPGDYEIAAYIFENIEVTPNYQGTKACIDALGDDGVIAVGGPTLAASPVHQIQKELIDHTQFFYEYNDNQKLIRSLAESIEGYFEKVLAVIAESPAEVVLWGANYDDMLTYPPYFEAEILPWLRRVSQELGARGKIMATHTDGENRGLMDLIRDCGCHVAESVTPQPMTKVGIEEYYRRWRDQLTIMGGIPESVLLAETATEAEFEAYLDHLFASVAPGDRLILGTADSTPPEAVFSRLDRIAERVEAEGRLPLTAGAGGPMPASRSTAAAVAEPATAGRAVAPAPEDPAVSTLQGALIAGDAEALAAEVRALLARGLAARAILNDGMLPAMERIGRLFRDGEVFVPEVLLSARAMNGALLLLEPLLRAAGGGEAVARVLIGTAAGDMHDIGKNLVAIMLRGVGFEVCDLGTNVSPQEFVRQVEQQRPDIVGISALLTTTMPMMQKTIEGLREAGLRVGVKVMVGGAPVNQKFADDIGADGYAADAGAAVELARSLCC
jgi:methylmalonyl-CoA mutase cobalamin-binding domain/chain